jgi:hypothetical protein
VLLVSLLFTHDIVWFVDYHFKVVWTYLWSDIMLSCVYCTTTKSMCNILFIYLVWLVYIML